MFLKSLGFVVALGSAALSSAALADDWVAVSISGIVMTVKDGHWTRLRPNEVVSDQQQIRTLASGRATFERRGEAVAIAGDTGISISEERGGRYTRVTEWLGNVTVSDNEQAAPHFEVDTPYMAAVVKGTVFTVWTKGGISGVRVTRGRVEVRDPNSHLHVNVLPGQEASLGTAQPLMLAGPGALQPILNTAGQPVGTAGDSSREAAGTSASATTSTAGSAVAGSDNGIGNGGTPGNGSQNTNAGGNGNSDKSDNGLGNGGTPGNGGLNGSAGGNGNSGKSDNGVGNGGTPGNGGQNGSAAGNGNSGGSGHGHG